MTGQKQGRREDRPTKSHDLPQLDILTARVSPIGPSTAAAVVAGWTSDDGAHAVCAANVHMLMEAVDDPSFTRTLAEADLLVCDGRPLVWAARLLGSADARHCRGFDLMVAVCERAARDGLKVGLYGSAPEVNEAVRRRLRERFPTLDITYSWSPPFRELSPEEEAGVMRTLATARPDILFVSLGCPRQERWMMAHRNELKCTMIGVGAAFDFHAETKKRAPQWMRRAGLEWAHRLGSEPTRLGGRYVKTNSAFLLKVIGSSARGRLAPRGVAPRDRAGSG